MLTKTTMTGSVLATSAAVTLVAAMLVVVFESPVRTAGALMTAFIGTGASLILLGASVGGELVILLGTGAIGIMTLSTVLIVNLTREERGPRRFHPVRIAAFLLLGWMTAGILPLILEMPGGPPAQQESSSVNKAHSAMAVTGACFDDTGIVVCVAVFAISAALVASLSLVRRKA